MSMKRFMRFLVALPIVLAMAWPAVTAQESAPPAEQKVEDDPRLVAIGGLGASTLYFSFMLIGTTADGFSKDAYTVDEVKEIVDSVSAMLKTNAEQVADVRKGNLIQDDAEKADEIIAIMGLIREYAKLLGDYAKAKDEEIAKTFDEQRQKIWDRMATLFGIK